MTAMKSVVIGIVQLFAGYVVGGVVGYFAILLFSDNAHDRSVEALDKRICNRTDCSDRSANRHYL